MPAFHLGLITIELVVFKQHWIHCELFIVIVQAEQNAAIHFVNQVFDKY
jgi:hypothetical protein